MQINDPYYLKYLKYKTKYLRLRDAISVEDANIVEIPEQEGGLITIGEKIIFFDTNDLKKYSIFSSKDSNIKITNINELKSQSNIGTDPNLNIQVNKNDLYKLLDKKAYKATVNDPTVKLIELTKSSSKSKEKSSPSPQQQTLGLDPKTKMIYDNYQKLSQYEKANFVNQIVNNNINNKNIIPKVDFNTLNGIVTNIPTLLPRVSSLNLIVSQIYSEYNKLTDNQKAHFFNYVINEISFHPVINKELLANLDVEKIKRLLSEIAMANIRTREPQYTTDLPKEIILRTPVQISVSALTLTLQDINTQLFSKKIAKKLNAVIRLRENLIGKDKIADVIVK